MNTYNRNFIIIVVVILAVAGAYFFFGNKKAPDVVQKVSETVVTDTIPLATVDFSEIKAKKSKDYVVKIADDLVSASSSADALYFVGTQKDDVKIDTPEEKVTEKKTTVYAVKIKDAKDVKISSVTVAGGKAVLNNKTANVKVEKPEAPKPPAEPVPAKK